MRTAFWRLAKLTGRWKWLLACFFFCHCNAQSDAYNFRHVTTNDGLSNGVIKSIAQDKYGYLWLATGSGVCLYNGYTIKVFLHADSDSSSAPDNSPVYILCDKAQRVWVSFESGLYRYDYNNSRFLLQPKTKGVIITKMIEESNGILYCLTRNELMVFRTADGYFTRPQLPGNNLLQKRFTDISVTKKGVVYLASDTGLVVYEPALHTAYVSTFKPIIYQPVTKLAIDADDNTWISYGINNNMVVKTNASFTVYRVYTNFLYSTSNMAGSQITNFFIDYKNRVWIATSRAGISLYDSTNDRFTSFINNPLQPISISSSHVTAVFQDKDGFIWAGTEGYGLNYFDPDNNLFHAVAPHYNTAFASSDPWCRIATEDKEGNLWMGSMNGVTLYNKQTGAYTTWQNKRGSADQLYSNSIRSLLCDNRGYVWIGTSDGLNRYNPSTKHMDFFGKKEAVPYSFFWALLQSHDGNIWIGCRDGLYRFNYINNKFENFNQDSLLSPYRSYNIISIFEDSRQRIWLGCFSKGLLMIDPEKHVTHWMKDSSNPAFINNNVRSFTEDKQGTIWIATTNGLAAYTPDGKFKKYGQEQGLKTLNICALLTDNHNRIWIGSGNGLFVLDSARKQFTSFSVKDGLPSAEFNEQSAFKTKKGIFIYPTMQGYVTFNPEEYKENNPQRSVYISAINVFSKKYSTPVNPEELKTLRLAADENFFSLELSSPNYSSPQRTWFAYKLEPFDKDWIYTKDRLINYTNVPGGNYLFHYKAAANKDNWNVAEKTMMIHIATPFYNTLLFRLLLLLLFVLLVFSMYKYRIRQSKKIYALQSKAQLLEKEKAVVQYENLKQQLNPHFLFNSLTSLRSLIRIDKQTAADFLDKISMNYRYILKSSESELVPIKDELAFAKTYIELQQTRFGNGLHISIEATEDTLHKKIVPVTIQNLIDNAIKHNSLNIDEPLMIRIFTEENYLIIANNLQIRESVETSNRHGLQYLISLYKYLDKRPILINQDTTHFSVKIPLL